MSAKRGFLRAQNTPGIAPEAEGGELLWVWIVPMRGQGVAHRGQGVSHWGQGGLMATIATTKRTIFDTDALWKSCSEFYFMSKYSKQKFSP